jgi:hypothetical protein
LIFLFKTVVAGAGLGIVAVGDMVFAVARDTVFVAVEAVNLELE